MAQVRRLFLHAFLFTLAVALLAACGGTPGPGDGDGDTTAPTVTLNSSTTTVTEPSTITLTAEADDNEGVTRVEFYRGGDLIGEADTQAPYEATVNLTADDDGTITFRAVAYDAAGNNAQDSVTVNVSIGGEPIDTGDSDPSPSDAYQTFGNTELIVEDAEENVATQDAAAVRVIDNVLSDDDGAPASVTAVAGTAIEGDGPVEAATVEGGTVFMDADGTFSYQPPVRVAATDFEDSFQYTNANGATNTVTISVSELIWYVDSSAAENGNGSSWAPFNVLADADDDRLSDVINDAEDAALTNETGDDGEDLQADYLGDYIFVFSNGDTPVHNGGIVLEDQQTLHGQGVPFEIGGMLLVEATPDTPPVLTSTTTDLTSGYGIVLGGNSMTRGAGVTIRGFTIRDTVNGGIYGTGTDGNGGIDGNVTIENVDLEAIASVPGGTLDRSAVKLEFVPGAETTLDISNVSILNPALDGIQVSKADTVVVDTVDVSGLTSGSGFEAIGLETGSAGDYTIRNVEITDPDATNVDGIYILKNGVEPVTGENVLTVTLENTTVTLNGAFNGTTGAETRGFVVVNHEDGADGVDFGADTIADPTDDASFDADGTVTLAGSGNTVTAVDVVVLAEDADDDGNPAEITGEVVINGTTYPEPIGTMSTQSLPALKPKDIPSGN